MPINYHIYIYSQIQDYNFIKSQFHNTLYKLFKQFFNNMLFHHHDIEPIQAKDRIIYIYENAAKETRLLLQLKLTKKKNKFSEISKLLGIHHLRLFNSQGAQYFEQDLEYIKDKTTLYASKGQDFDPSSCFGQYKIIKELGQGGFGKVLLGQHKLTKQKVAIKIIKTQNIGSAHDIDNVFVQAQILKSLNHDNIVKVYNCLTLPNMQVAIIMQYLQGGQLLAYVQKKQRLNEQQSCIFFKQIVKAMTYCHQHNLIHRDLKLQNLLLLNNQEKKIKIIDFGIAGAIHQFKIEDIDTGSLNYMAPQCFFSIKSRKIDGGVDVWGAGVILFGMLVGDLPFKGNTTDQKIQSIKSGNYKIPNNIMKQLSENCLDILKRCLDPNPETRIKMDDLTVHPWISDNFFGQQKKQKIKEQIKPIIQEKKIKQKDNNKLKVNSFIKRKSDIKPVTKK